MSVRSTLALCILFSSLLGTSVTAYAMSDEDIARLVVGSWIADPSALDALQSKAQELEHHTMVIYNADRTGRVDVYTDTTCTKILFSNSFSWSVDDGKISFHGERGTSSTDIVISLDSRTMVEREDKASHGPTGLMEHRVRALTCSTPVTDDK